MGWNLTDVFAGGLFREPPEKSSVLIVFGSLAGSGHFLREETQECVAAPLTCSLEVFGADNGVKGIRERLEFKTDDFGVLLAGRI